MDTQVMAAARDLRLALGESQQNFGIRLGSSTISVARYERSRAPRGKVLAKLAEIAADRGLDRLEDTFRRALSDELGGPPPAGLLTEPLHSGEKDLIFALLEILRKAQYAKEAEEVRRILRRVAHQRKEDADFLEAQQRGRSAITRLLRKGYGVDSIRTRMGEPIEKIAEALFRSADIELIQQRAPEVVRLLEKNGWTIKRVFQEFGDGLAGAIRADALGIGTGEMQSRKKNPDRKR
jgi:transcriptional regulator with XRE-family HTH domain